MREELGRIARLPGAAVGAKDCSMFHVLVLLIVLAGAIICYSIGYGSGIVVFIIAGIVFEAFFDPFDFWVAGQTTIAACKKLKAFSKRGDYCASATGLAPLRTSASRRTLRLRACKEIGVRKIGDF